MIHLPFSVDPDDRFVRVGAIGQLGDAMTTAQAAALRVKWTQRMGPRPCAHLGLEVERDDSGFFTGNFHCIVCGELVPRKNEPPPTPHHHGFRVHPRG